MYTHMQTLTECIVNELQSYHHGDNAPEFEELALVFQHTLTPVEQEHPEILNYHKQSNIP